jgi:protein-disulfide isomerase
MFAMSAQVDKSKPRPVSGRAERRRQEEQRARTRKLLFLGGVLTIGLVVAIGLIVISQRSDDNGTGLPALVAANPLDASIPSDGRVLGDPNAPVTLVEWADYQCPFCKAFGDNVIPKLIDEFVKTGKLKIEYRDMPFVDDQSGSGESDMAAEAAACAADQGKFWQMHDTIFANQSGENEGAFSKDRLKTMGQLAGLDVGQFNTCFDAGTHKPEVQASEAEGLSAGVNSTPTLFIDGNKIDFTGKYEDLKADIEAALAA